MSDAVRTGSQIQFLAILLAASCSLIVFERSAAIASCPPSASERSTIDRMLRYARGHASQALIAMEPAIARSHDRTIADLYPLSLYLADHRRFSRRFIDEFPTDDQMRMACVLEDIRIRNGLAIHGLDPFKILGTFALSGDRIAIAKTLIGQSDGSIAEYTTDLNTRIVTRFPHTALAAIQQMTEAQRSRAICYNLDAYYDRKGYDRFLALRPASQAESVLLKDLNRLHTLCATDSKTL